METEHFDTDAFFAAIDAERKERDKSWKEVAAESGVSASTLTRMAQGKRPDVDGLAALVKWSGLKTEDYIVGKAKSQPQPNTMAVVSSLLRADKKLSKESAIALEHIFRVAYKRMVD